jgi:hypothetical protein
MDSVNFAYWLDQLPSSITSGESARVQLPLEEGPPFAYAFSQAIPSRSRSLLALAW